MTNIQKTKRVLSVNANVTPFRRGFEPSFLPYEYKAPSVPQQIQHYAVLLLRSRTPVKADSKPTQIVTRQEIISPQ
jgi:hypothetical protein